MMKIVKKLLIFIIPVILALSLFSIKTFAYSEKVDENDYEVYRRFPYQTMIVGKYDNSSYSTSNWLIDMPKSHFYSTSWNPYYYFNSPGTNNQNHEVQILYQEDQLSQDIYQTILYDENFETSLESVSFITDKFWLNYDILNTYFTSLLPNGNIVTSSFPQISLGLHATVGTTYTIHCLYTVTLSEFTVNRRDIGGNQQVITSTYSNEQEFSFHDFIVFTADNTAFTTGKFPILPKVLLDEWDTTYQKFNQFEDSYYINFQSTFYITQSKPSNIISFDEVHLHECFATSEFTDDFISNFYSVSHTEVFELESFLDLAPSIFESVFNALNVKIFGFMSLMDLVIMFVTLSIAFLLIKVFLGG